MALTKKKPKTVVKKNAKGSAKKITRRITKKTAKSPAKRKMPAARKKTKNPVRKKTAVAVSKKTNTSVRKKVPAPASKKAISAAQMETNPGVIKQNEDLHPLPVENEMNPDRVEENKKIEELKKLEHQFENREEVIMNQENQKVKSAMANREGIKRVFRTTRHR